MNLERIRGHRERIAIGEGRVTGLRSTVYARSFSRHRAVALPTQQTDTVQPSSSLYILLEERQCIQIGLAVQQAQG